MNENTRNKLPIHSTRMFERKIGILARKSSNNLNFDRSMSSCLTLVYRRGGKRREWNIGETHLRPHCRYARKMRSFPDALDT